MVASRVGGLPEIVLHEETGLLTENDPAAVRRRRWNGSSMTQPWPPAGLQRPPPVSRNVSRWITWWKRRWPPISEVAGDARNCSLPRCSGCSSAASSTYVSIVCRAICRVVWPGSRCLDCGHAIAACDNIPVLSYFLLGARCRHCRSSISWRYPVVEALTGSLVWRRRLVWGPTPQAAKFALFAFLLVGMIFADLETRLLPDEFTKGGIVAGPGISLLVPIKSALMAVFLAQKVCAVCLADRSGGGGRPGEWGLLGHRFIHGKVRDKEVLGFGDVKMVAMIGAFHGIAPTLMTVTLVAWGAPSWGLAIFT